MVCEKQTGPAFACGLRTATPLRNATLQVPTGSHGVFISSPTRGQPDCRCEMRRVKESLANDRAYVDATSESAGPK